jgi:hypothetical protein
MKKETALEKLQEIAMNRRDKEFAHMAADQVLLDYIGDVDITDAFEKIDKWYS